MYIADFTITKSVIMDLADQPLIDFGRKYDSLWIRFGESVSYLHNNELKHGYRYALHVQCPWRVIFRNEILLGSDDMFELKRPDEIYFNRKDVGSNLFDVKRKDFLSKYNKDIYVQKATIKCMGDLAISFSKNFKLEVYPCESIMREFWRLIIYGDDYKKYVIFNTD